MRRFADNIGLPVLAIALALLLFGALVSMAGVSPVEVWVLLFKGAFGDWYSWQNTLQRAAPLILTALCVAIPARAGLVIIGGEGALVLGGLACAALPYAVPLPANVVGSLLVCAAGAAAGAVWVALAGWLRQARGINETISSLLLAYVAIGLFKHFVEGTLRDPGSLNKPSTYALPEGIRIGGMGGRTSIGALHLGCWPALALVFGCVGRLRALRCGLSGVICGRRNWWGYLQADWSSQPVHWAARVPGWQERLRWQRCTPMPMLH